MTDSPFSHIDDSGKAKMVDVGEKQETVRSATAAVVCVMDAKTGQAIRANSMAKGDVLQVARIAGICAAKRTDELIPLCHSLLLESVDVSFHWVDEQRLAIEVTSRATGKTGVEMEAMVGASIAGLTVYDMCKSSDRSMVLESVQLLRKSGGKRGDYERAST
ncbi:MAG: cyclic pyranopterin monophosphate synthase MoaC [Planctomycetales bacterium]|nr:cyclic pyranopterin monophosphate synthase MoaC [Planctomycetales bacterium]